MADEEYTFAQARARLDELVAQARRKDTSLEHSMDVLDEGVRLINRCTELVDQVELGDASHADAGASEGETEVAPAELEREPEPAPEPVRGE